MQLIAPEILVEARALSPVLQGIAYAIGAFLWLFGWRWHRFWIVVSVTVAGGVIGLYSGRISGGHILATGVLLAIASGLLALELSRIAAFLAGGTALWYATVQVFPNGQELWIAFLIGGIVSTLLYQFWMMLLTSFVGTLLASYALLVLLERFQVFPAISWAQPRGTICNSIVLGLTILGLIVQSWLERHRLRSMERRKKADEERIRQQERERVEAELPSEPPTPPSPKPKKIGFWDRLFGRKAGVGVSSH